MEARVQKFRFSGFELDPGARVLAKGGRRVPLQDKPLDLLLYLLLNRDRVVSRSELQRELWPNVTVGPEALRFALYSVRRAVRDGRERKTILRTIPKVGIQFAAEVETVESLEPLMSREYGLFVGRQHLTDLVATSLSRLKVRRGSTMMIYGPPGIGKTAAARLIHQFALRLNYHALRGDCLDRNAATSYGPWAQLLDSRNPHLFARPQGRLSQGVSRPLSTAWSPSDDTNLRARAPHLEVADSLRIELFDNVVYFLRSLARNAPVVVILDDLHQADEQSVQLLEFAAHALAHESVLFVATYRDRAPDSIPSVAARISSIAALDWSQSVHLSGLTLQESCRLIHARSGVKPADEQAKALHSRSNGNPLFLRQLLQVLEAENRLDELTSNHVSTINLPEFVREAILKTLGSVTDDTYRLLQAASVVGAVIRPKDLTQALDQSAPRIAGRLEAAVSEGLLEERKAETAFSFTHDLIREAVYQSLEQADRDLLHQLVANSIQQDRTLAWGARAGEVAGHLAAAHEPDCAQKAVDFLIAAAVWETERGGFDRAASHLETTIQHLEDFSPGDTGRHGEAWIRLGDARTCAGDRDGARAAFYEAIRIAEVGRHPRLMALAALRFSPDFLAIETGVYDADLVSVLERALTAIPENAHTLKAMLSARLAVALHWKDGSETRRAELIKSALDLVARSADQELAAYVTTAKALALFSLDPKALHSLRAPIEDSLDPASDLVRRLMRITALWLAGQVSEVRTEIDEYGHTSSVSRAARTVWYRFLLQSSLALMEGRFDEAVTLRQKFLEVGQTAGDRNSFHSYVLQAFMASIDVGGVENFEDGVRSMIREYPRVMGWQSGLLLLLTELGRFSEATELLDRIIADGGLTRLKRNEWYALVGPLVIASSRTKHERWSTELYELLLPHRDQIAVIGYGSYCWGSTEQLLGLCAVAGGDLGRGVEHFEAALDANRLIGAHPAVGRVHLDAAAALLRGGKRSDAGYHQARCVAIGSRLGMNRLVSRAQGLGIA